MTLVAAAQDAAAVAAVTAVLAAHDGNRTHAARTLGWSRQGLYGWLTAHPAVAQAYPARLRGRPLGSGKKSVVGT